MYQSLWLKIQAAPDTAIGIHAPRKLHARIMKALHNERSLASINWPESYGYILHTRSVSTNKIEVRLETLAGLAIKRSMDAGAPLFFTPTGEIYEQQ